MFFGDFDCACSRSLGGIPLGGAPLDGAPLGGVTRDEGFREIDPRNTASGAGPFRLGRAPGRSRSEAGPSEPGPSYTRCGMKKNGRRREWAVPGSSLQASNKGWCRRRRRNAPACSYAASTLEHGYVFRCSSRMRPVHWRRRSRDACACTRRNSSSPIC